MTVPIAGSQTGVFTDLSHTVTVAAGDMVNSMIVGGAQSGSATISIKTVTMWTEIAGQVTGPTKCVTLEEAITLGNTMQDYRETTGHWQHRHCQQVKHTKARLRLKTYSQFPLPLGDEYAYQSQGQAKDSDQILGLHTCLHCGVKGQAKNPVQNHLPQSMSPP